MRLSRRGFLLGTVAVAATAAIGAVPLLPKTQVYSIAEFYQYLANVWDDGGRLSIATVKPDMTVSKLTPFSEGIHPPYRRGAIADDFEINYSSKVIRYAVN